MTRLPAGGLIDRNISVPFRFDGQVLTAHPGDTLASALLANGVRLVGRSFKYHRPRGIQSAGSDEPNALVETGAGAALTPNTRATVQEVFAGLEANSQNRWPNLRNDILAVNDRIAPLLGAGFYYKTFMWPRRFWHRLYEPFIRRAAGLGHLSGQADTTPAAKAFAHCDILVIGSGPAGLAAALTAAKGGARVILAEEDFRFGGRLNSESETLGGASGAHWAGEVLATLGAMDNVTLMPRTTVTGAYDGGIYGALERVAEHLPEAQRKGMAQTVFWRIHARRVVLASGAGERMIAFPDNDRPGIMLAGAVRSYVNRFAVAPGSRVCVFTNNDSGWRTVGDLQAAGIGVAALVDVRADVTPPVDCPVYTGAAVVATTGRCGLEGITIRTSDGARVVLETDCLAVSGGWNPVIQLTGHTGARPQWHAEIAAFRARPDSIDGLEVAGAADGHFDTAAALASGQTAARRALKALGLKQARPKLSAPDETAQYRITPFWHVADAKGKAFVDFQHDVTTQDIRQAFDENFRSVEHLKRYTTLGMGTDQGKGANVTALAIMAELGGRSIPDTGTTVSRPPFTPVSFGAMGAGGQGAGFAPERRLPSAEFNRAAGAHMLEVGLWHRPGWFPRAGETHWRQACDREVGFVRNSVGVCDVSTLGKIALEGPDAAAFLDRIYTGSMSKLPVGRIRYGLMLREDGAVLDDGTLACLGAGRYLLSTTTGAAAEVLAHLEFHAARWPELDLQIADVTEHWAQFAVTGPQTGAVLAQVLDGLGVARADWQDLPFMGLRVLRVAGMELRLLRVSFSGETGVELAVPAGFGAEMMRRLDKAAQAAGGGVYGLEALNVLRLEKGFLTHAEMDGRTTAADLGLATLCKTAPPYTGQAAAARLATQKGRQQLVGLVPSGAVHQMTGGAVLVAVGTGAGAEAGADTPPAGLEAIEGYVTSAAYSPTLEHSVALALLEDGRARLGQEVLAIDQMRDLVTRCRVVALPFLDPDGQRARAPLTLPEAPDDTAAAPKPLTRRAPVDGLPFVAGGLTLAQRENTAMALLAPFAGQGLAAGAALREICGATLPKQGKRVQKGAVAVHWHAPGQWLVEGDFDLPALQSALEGVALLADVSDAFARLHLSGAGATRALAYLTPLDPQTLDKTDTARLELAHLPARLSRSENGFDLLLPRSAAAWGATRIRRALEMLAAREG